MWPVSKMCIISASSGCVLVYPLNMTSQMQCFYDAVDWIEQCFTSPPTQYRLYGRRFLQVKRPNGNIPPWRIQPFVTDDELARNYSKHSEPQLLLASAQEKIQSYQDCIQVYTDASKTTDGKVGIGCYVKIDTNKSQ